MRQRRGDARRSSLLPWGARAPPPRHPADDRGSVEAMLDAAALVAPVHRLRRALRMGSMRRCIASGVFYAWVRCAGASPPACPTHGFDAMIFHLGEKK